MQSCNPYLLSEIDESPLSNLKGQHFADPMYNQYCGRLIPQTAVLGISNTVSLIQSVSLSQMCQTIIVNCK